MHLEGYVSQETECFYLFDEWKYWLSKMEPLWNKLSITGEALLNGDEEIQEVWAVVRFFW